MSAALKSAAVYRCCSTRPIWSHGSSRTGHLHRRSISPRSSGWTSRLVPHRASLAIRSVVNEARPPSTERPEIPPGESNTVEADGVQTQIQASKVKRQSTSQAYLELAKAKLSSLVVTTAAAGFVAVGGPIAPQLDVLAACVVGTGLCSASAAAWNQIFEVDRDRQMKRTQTRPLVSGTLTPSQAKVAATLWGAAGTSILALGTDPVTTALGAGNIVFYAGVYTAMKPRTIYNTWVGAVVGAIPPVMGWTAATGGSLCEIEPFLLGYTLFAWQMPHFFALGYMHRVDYKRGGFQMVPSLESDGSKTAALIVRYAWYLSVVPFVATLTNLTSSMFAFEGIALNAYALSVAYQFKRERTNANARKIFLTSLWYLPCLLTLFLLHSKSWDREKEENDFIAQFLADHIHLIRDKGRELCVHEAAVTKVVDGSAACPVSVASKQSRKNAEEASAAITHTAVTVTSTVQRSSQETQSS